MYVYSIQSFPLSCYVLALSSLSLGPKLSVTLCLALLCLCRSMMYVLSGISFASFIAVLRTHKPFREPFSLACTCWAPENCRNCWRNFPLFRPTLLFSLFLLSLAVAAVAGGLTIRAHRRQFHSAAENDSKQRTANSEAQARSAWRQQSREDEHGTL